MFSHIRSVLVFLLAGGVAWNCSGERVTTPPVTEADLPARGALSKPAVRRDVDAGCGGGDGATGCVTRWWCDRGIFAFGFGTGSGLCVVCHNR